MVSVPLVANDENSNWHNMKRDFIMAHKSMSISWISVGVIQEVKQCHQQTSSLAFLSYSLFWCHSQT